MAGRGRCGAGSLALQATPRKATCTEKIAFFEEQEILAADPGVRFQLKKQLDNLRAQPAKLEAELVRLRVGGGDSQR
jgi:hypothetical protein